MKLYDVVVIGAGRIGRVVAHELSRRNKKIAVVSFSEPVEDYLYHLNAALTRSAGSPFSLPSLDVSIPLDHIDFYPAPCQFENARTLKVQDQTLSAKKFALAMGTVPRPPFGPAVESNVCLNAIEALSLVPRPRSAAIIGAGPIGVCLAQFLSQEGCSVTLFSRRSRVLPNEEPEISSTIEQILEKAGVRVEKGADVKNASRSDEHQIQITYAQRGAIHHTVAHAVIAASGLVSHHKGMRLEKAGAYINETNAIVTNDEMRTSSPSVWAAGSAAGPPFLLSLENHHAQVVVNNLTAPFFAKHRSVPEPLPFTCPTAPALARIGLTEQEARRQFKDVRVVVYSLDKNPKTILRREFAGVIKLVGRKKSGQLLGAHLLAPHAEEMIVVADVMLRAGIPFHEMTDPHHWPALTYGEALLEAMKEWVQ